MKRWVDGEIISGMTVEMSSERWQGLWDDGSEKMRSSGVQNSDKLPRSIYGARHVSSQLACILDWSVASSFVHLSYKIHHPSSHSFAFCRKHSVRASPSSLSEIRPFNSCIIQSHPLTLFLGKWFNPFNLFLFSAFILPFLAKIYGFLHPSPFFNPSVLGSVTTCRQCLVH